MTTPVYTNINGQLIKQPSDHPARPFREAWIPDGQSGITIDPVKRAEIAMKLFEEAIETHIEATAAGRGYANATRLASYVASTKPAWKAEAEAFVAWRDNVWEFAFTELAKVQGGQRSEPRIEAFIAELPAITWPK